jgi:hypothetical protein
MGKGQDKRQAIFDKYLANRNLLIEHKLGEGEKNIYICPICAKTHKTIDEEDPLTLEDAPPKSLGGKANTLTCKTCNNTCGHTIDFHLTERLKELDSAKFLPNTETRVKIKIGEEFLNGIVSIDENGKMTISHSDKNNNPVKLDDKMIGLKDGELVDLSFLKTRVIPEKLEYALLKTGYLLAFEKFGGSMIFDKNFNIVRDQLLNPEVRIYPENFWFTPMLPQNMEGVYFVLDKGLECLLAIFNLDTGFSLRKFGTFLPCPVNDIGDVIGKLIHKTETDKGFTLELYPLQQGDTKYLEDNEQINELHNWIGERKK